LTPSGWQTFVQVGLALAQIRDDRLYKVDFDTFEAPIAGSNGSMAAITSTA
jgi:hypothetical protein